VTISDVSEQRLLQLRVYTICILTVGPDKWKI